MPSNQIIGRHCLLTRVCLYLRYLPSRKQTIPILLALTVCSILSSSCTSNDSSTQWTGSVDTLPGGGIVVSNPINGIWDAESAWHLEEELRIGSLDGEEYETFADIGYIAVDEHDNIYILDDRAQEIRVFDAGGSYMRTVGRKGNGPGEFRSARGVGLDAHYQLWVPDWRSNIYSVFDSNGAFIKDYPIPDRTASGYWGGTILGNGSLYDFVREATNEGQRDVLVRFDTIAGFVDSIPLPIHEVKSWLFSGTTTTGNSVSGMRIHFNVPFSAEQHSVLEPSGFIWLATSDDMSFSKIDLNTDTALVVKRVYDPVPVTEADRDRVLSPLSAMDGMNGNADPADIPEFKPAFRSFTVDDVGQLWVFPSMHTDALGTLIDVYNSDGKYQGQLETQERLRMLPTPVVGNASLYAVVRDEMDVPYVVKYSIHKGIDH